MGTLGLLGIFFLQNIPEVQIQSRRFKGPLRGKSLGFWNRLSILVFRVEASWKLIKGGGGYHLGIHHLAYLRPA